MFNSKIEKAINEQIKEELFSSYLYLSMSAYFEGIGLDGFAHWMRLQSKEEYEHAMKFFDYIITRGGSIELNAIDKPKKEWKSVQEVFDETYAHEQHITSKINELVALSIEENDYATKNFLDWYVNEQVEEEENCVKILDTLKYVGDHKHGLFMFNKELGGRK